MESKKIIEVKNITKSFSKNNKQDLLVLDDVNFDVNTGETIAIVGKSGSGKSTLLRIIAGLIEPSSGSVFFKGSKIKGPEKGLTMIFQNFALLPWLSVLENVELGLQAAGVLKKERTNRAVKAIDIVGLDGFESAYPRELSGGMAQRVGFARALVMEPDVILMDEPFSALDVLTAENLKGDLVNILLSKDTNIKSVIIVTHNIEEAAFLANKILVFDNNPGYVRATVPCDLPYPRDSHKKDFKEIVDDIYGLMTTPDITQLMLNIDETDRINIGYRLPKVEISELVGFMEELESYENREKFDLPEIAEKIHLEINELFPITEALEILGFAKVSEGDIELTQIGKNIVETDILGKKKIFAKQLLAKITLAKFIRKTLDYKPSHEVSEEVFIAKLTEYLSENAAEEVLSIIIDWGRYAEIFAYDYDSGLLSLENPK